MFVKYIKKINAYISIEKSIENRPWNPPGDIDVPWNPPPRKKNHGSVQATHPKKKKSCARILPRGGNIVKG